MEPMQIIDYAAISVTLFFLALGSVFDLKTREVSDRAWLIYGPVGLILTISRLLLDPSLLIPTVASIVVTTLIVLGLFYFGLFGGADAKAIICLAVTLPLIPIGIQPLIGYVHPFFPIVVIIVSFICSLSVAVWVGVRNVLSLLHQGSQMFDGLRQEPSWKKAIAFITGYPSEPSKLIATYYLYPIEEVAENADGAHRKFRLMFSAETDRNALVSKLIDSLSKVGSPSKVWVSPGLPMLLFVLIGLVITILVGDPVFSTIFMLTSR